MRHAAFRAAADQADDHDDDSFDGQRRSLNKALATLLADEDIRSAQLAITLLGRTGGSQEAVLLQAFARETPVLSPDIGQQARDAASVIRGRERKRRDEPQPEVDLEAISKELEDLEERLERLEEWR